MKDFAGVSISSLVKKYGSPIYIYDLDSMVGAVQSLKTAFEGQVEIHYATKANSHPLILKAFLKEKIGVDTVSWGEAEEALNVGFKPKDIIFSGVAKTSVELTQAIRKQIKQINVESPQELIRIGEIAKKLKKKAQVAFRMNPNVNPNTHPYITTGFRENKFGMDTTFLPELRGILRKYAKHLDLKGVTLHVGSQLRDLSGILDAIQKTIPVFLDLKHSGFHMETFDIGGGIGIPYDGSEPMDLKLYATQVVDLLKPLGCRILTEPGRILVGPYGILVGEIQYIKASPYKNFAILDTGMHHLMRPALYQAFHRMEKVGVVVSDDKVLYDIVGPICESSDVIGRDRYLPILEQGDLIAIRDAGAYGFSMASFYNAHALPKEIIISSKKATTLKKPHLPDSWL